MKIITRTREEVVRRWVAALRCGGYTQARNFLRNNTGGFCCLGVLCDLAARDGGPQWVNESHYLGGNVNLPSVISEFVTGYRGNRADRCVIHFAKRNDAGDTFAELADIIEKDLL